MGVGTIVLFGAAMIIKNHKACTDIKVEITGADEHLFIDEKDVKDLINEHSNLENKKMNEVNLKAIETELEKTPWVKNAELFFDNNQILQVRIEERQPVGRVFTVEGSSFYIDSSGVRLPLSDKLSARVPMFTNFPSDKAVMAASDSELLQGVVQMGKFITADSFWRAQIAQVYITPQGTFELTPTVGNQTIVFGDADDLDNKFNNLYTFYKKAWLQNGINTYSKLDVRFENQVVGVKRGAEISVADTAKANAAIQALMIDKSTVKAKATMPAKDSTGTEKEKDKNKLKTSLPQNNKRRSNTFSIVRKSGTLKK
jgi:cell division protein FtsQ